MSLKDDSLSGMYRWGFYHIDIDIESKPLETNRFIKLCPGSNDRYRGM